MKVLLKVWFIALLLAFFAAGCGCGGGGVDLISIEVTPANPTIQVGSQQQFTAIGTFADNTTKDITTSVDWSLSDGSIAQISNDQGSKGLATALAKGVTTVTATFGNISGSTTLTVTPALVSISVVPASASVQIGANQQFAAIGTFTDNSQQDITNSVDWSSSDGSIAQVSNQPGSKGLATGIAAGQITITAKSGNISGQATLTVTSVTLVSITVTPAIKIAKFDTTVQFTAIGTFSDGSTKDITTAVEWSSSDESIATISNAPGSQGLATTDHLFGRTTIKATSGNISGTALLIDP